MRRKSGSIILLLLMMPYLIESGHLGEGAERSKYFTLITLILNSHFLSWFLWSYESPIVHDYYKCNDINHEKFYKCQFVRDPASGATSSTSSFAQTCFLISAFKLIFDPGARFFWALKCHKKLLPITGQLCVVQSLFEVRIGSILDQFKLKMMRVRYEEQTTRKSFKY